MDNRTLAENLLEYVIDQCQGKDADQMLRIMYDVLGRLKEDKFEKLKLELGII